MVFQSQRYQADLSLSRINARIDLMLSPSIMAVNSTLSAGNCSETSRSLMDGLRPSVRYMIIKQRCVMAISNSFDEVAKWFEGYFGSMVSKESATVFADTLRIYRDIQNSSHEL